MCDILYGAVGLEIKYGYGVELRGTQIQAEIESDTKQRNFSDMVLHSDLFRTFDPVPRKEDNPLPVVSDARTPETKKSAPLDDRTRAILQSRAWDVATSPVKSVMMNLFMLWMMGTGAGIFSLLFVVYALTQSVSTLFRVHKVFQPYDQIQPLAQKTIYVVLSLGVLYYLGDKAGSMGLLPITPADWLFTP